MSITASGENCLQATNFVDYKKDVASSNSPTQTSIEMKPVLAFAVLECLLLFCCLQQFGLAVPTVEAKDDVAAVSFDVKRGAEYRNALFGVYTCRVKKAADAVKDTLQIRF